MKNIEKNISSLVQSHFPAFYQEEGPLFIEFVKSYYKWLETENQQLFYSRKLLDLKDVDKTIDDFLIHFNKTYLSNIPLQSVTNQRLLLKKILSLYQNKGDEVSAKIAIQALFNEKSSIYYPSTDVFRLSNGKWVKPKYLELTISDRTQSYLNKEIIGTDSNAKAFCESIVRKRINGKFVDVMFLSNIRGDFSYGEKIVLTSNTIINEAPVVTGSLNKLSVLTGGQNFSIGDIFDVVSSNGRDAKAIVRSISTDTGKVNFEIVDGGWGFSNVASIYISDKVLAVSNVTNSNNAITSFYRFESVEQQLMNVGFTSAVNSYFFTPNTVLFAEGTTNATAGIVVTNLISPSQGTIKVKNISGNIVATNTVFKASLVDLVFDTAANIALFSNGIVIESVNATSNSSAYVIIGSSSNTTHGTLLLRPIVGNVASTNTTFRLQTNNAVQATVNTYTQNLYFTATVANNADETAKGLLIGSNSSHIGLDTVLNTFYIGTQFSSVSGNTSNTKADFNFVSSGTSASFQIGSLDDEESAIINTDFLNSNNVGNVSFMSINLDLSPSNSNSSGYGFVKYAAANLNSVILSALNYQQKNLGKIASLTSINPGDNYNIDPFVLVYESTVAQQQLRDFNLSITGATKNFSIGEKIEQTVSSPALQISVTNFSGTAANGSPMSNFELNEYVYQSNGSANIAAGFVYSSGLSGGSGVVKLYNVSGTFEVTSTNGYQIRSVTSNSTSNATSITSTTVATTYYGVVKSGSNSTSLNVKRTSLGANWNIGTTILGIQSGAVATISDFTIDPASSPIGENANIATNVQAANAVVKTVEVLDSGFGYLDKENVSLVKSNSAFIVTAQTSLEKQGEGEGYYENTEGFVSSDKKLHDNDYYQQFSYEIQSKVPFVKYSDILKSLLHVSGTRMFGKVVLTSFLDSSLNDPSAYNKKYSVQFSNTSSSLSFSNNELIVFSNGNSNSTLSYVTKSNLTTATTNNVLQNIIVLETAGNTNNFQIGRNILSPNATTYTASGVLVAKNSNNASNITILYVNQTTGTFTSSCTVSGYISANVSNTTTENVTLSNAVTVYGFGNVSVKTISKILVPVSDTLSSTLTGTISFSTTSANIIGTTTSFTTNFSNNDFVYLDGGASTDLVQIKKVSNTTHMELYRYPNFANTTANHKKSFTFISNTVVKTPNIASNAAGGTIVSSTSNSSYYVYYLSNVYGSFINSNTVQGYINNASTNTYNLTSAINTVTVSNTYNRPLPNTIITGTVSGLSAKALYLEARLEK